MKRLRAFIDQGYYVTQRLDLLTPSEIRRLLEYGERLNYGDTGFLGVGGGGQGKQEGQAVIYPPKNGTNNDDEEPTAEEDKTA